jgi:hypothetical protein
MTIHVLVLDNNAFCKVFLMVIYFIANTMYGQLLIQYEFDQGVICKMAE